MKKLIEQAVNKYRVTVRGVTDKMDDPFSFTHASNEGAALRNVMHKIARAVEDRGPNKGWEYVGKGGFKAVISTQWVNLIIRYLLDNPETYTVEKL